MNPGATRGILPSQNFRHPPIFAALPGIAPAGSDSTVFVLHGRKRKPIKEISISVPESHLRVVELLFIMIHNSYIRIGSNKAVPPRQKLAAFCQL
jgi:hypothetical protein